MGRRKREDAPRPSEELAGAELGDERLNRRLGLLADAVAEAPGAGFPKALDDAELEAAYRFFGNERVTPEAILAPHLRQSARRAAERSRVLVVHDTTQFEFGGQKKREGLGRLIRPGQGFFGHFSLAVTADGTRRPLGLLNVETVFRLDQAKPKAERRKADNRGESIRWRNGVEASEALLAGRAWAIHVMDREGDSYAILSALDAAKRSFVIRSFRDRVLAGQDHERLQATAATAKATLQREVPLSPRPRIKGPKGERHPARRHRLVSFAAVTVNLPRTTDAAAAASRCRSTSSTSSKSTRRLASPRSSGSC